MILAVSLSTHSVLQYRIIRKLWKNKALCNIIGYIIFLLM